MKKLLVDGRVRWTGEVGGRGRGDQQVVFTNNPKVKRS